MKDQTRRTLAIIAFLILGLGPIFVLMYMGVERRLPGYVHQEEVRLTQLLGVATSIDRIDHPRPGTTVYCDLVLSDPETGATILTTPSVEIIRECATSASIPETPPLAELIEQLLGSESETRPYLLESFQVENDDENEISDMNTASSDAKKKGTLPQWTIQIDELTFHQGTLRNLPGAIERLFTKRTVRSDSIVEFNIGVVTFDSSSQFGLLDQSRSRLCDMNGRLLFLPEISQVDLSFAFDDALDSLDAAEEATDPSDPDENAATEDNKEMIRVAAWRFHSSNDPKTRIRVSSRSEALPLSVLTLFVEDLDFPIGQTTFQGELIAESSEEGWSGAVLGTLGALDLGYKPEGYDSWALAASSMRLMLAARFEEDRIVAAGGWVDIPQGSFGRELANSWSETFAVPFSLPAEDGRDTVSFQQFRIQFDMNGPVLLCSPWSNDGLVAMGQYGPLLRTEYAIRPVPIHSFLGAMTPHSEEGVVYSPWVARLERVMPSFDSPTTEESGESP